LTLYYHITDVHLYHNHVSYLGQKPPVWSPTKYLSSNEQRRKRKMSQV